MRARNPDPTNRMKMNSRESADRRKKMRLFYNMFGSSDEEPLERMFRTIVNYHYDKVTYVSLDVCSNALRVLFRANNNSFSIDFRDGGHTTSATDEAFVRNCREELDSYLRRTDP